MSSAARAIEPYFATKELGKGTGLGILVVVDHVLIAVKTWTSWRTSATSQYVELADKARAIRPQLPILLASGYAELPAGAKLQLPRLGKPFLQADLAAKLSELLS